MGPEDNRSELKSVLDIAAISVCIETPCLDHVDENLAREYNACCIVLQIYKVV